MGLSAASRHGRRARGASGRSNFDLRFVGAFVLWWLAGLAVLALVPGLQTGVLRGTMRSLAVVLQVLRVPYEFHGTQLQLAGHWVDITDECTPTMPALLLCSALIAWPMRARDKLIAGGVGVAVLWVYNLLRIVTSAAVFAWQPSLFALVHVYLWQTISIVLTFGLFALAVRTSLRPRSVP